MNKIWVYAESAEGKPTTATLELLTKARELGSTVEALYAGGDADALAAPLGEYGATKLFVIDPADGGNVPESMLKIVLLPEPFGPIRPRISP